MADRTRSESVGNLTLPPNLRADLDQYRRRLWFRKSAEAVSVATVGLLMAYFTLFGFDRLTETSVPLRTLAALVGLAALVLIPYVAYRWIWSRRKDGQVARLISSRLPHAGDRLLGVLDLIADPREQSRSPALCRAAVAQVAADAEQWDLTQGLPVIRHRAWGVPAMLLVASAAALAVIAWPVAYNTWQRLVMPWRDVPRYTFARLHEIPFEKVVAHGESFAFNVRLDPTSQWKPRQARLQVGTLPPLVAALHDDRYEFDIPPQTEPVSLDLRVGDAIHQIQLDPTHRPELTNVVAHVALPSYLQRPSVEEDARSGSLVLVDGSVASIHAFANRRLATAYVDTVRHDLDSNEIVAGPIADDASRIVEFRWKDSHGLFGKTPFALTVERVEDQVPVVSCDGLRRQQVILDTEQVRFRLQANDDFGVKEVGMEWRGFEPDGTLGERLGDRVLAPGAPDRLSVEAQGTFTPSELGITPQAIELRIYAEDYLSEHGRAYSTSFLLYVLDKEQHAVWITEQLNKWHRRALEVRDRELQLYEANKELRALSADQLNLPETRDRIERQAAAERTNGRRLSGLTSLGEDLLRQASRNSEMGVGHLEKWAEMVNLLADISANRMPSVADLLTQAASAPQVAANRQPAPPSVGMNRAPGASAGSEPDEQEETQPARPSVPQIADVESTQQPNQSDPNDAVAEEKQNPSASSLTLPTTQLVGKGGESESCPAGEQMEHAIVEQRDLLAEFEKIANELNELLANLEGSTLVKRLKAAARKQLHIADDISDVLEPTFGAQATAFPDPARSQLISLADAERVSSEQVSYIMDDIQAFFSRRPLAKFGAILDEMKSEDVVGNLRQLGEAIPADQGLSIAECEYWSDTMDRWAEDLVDPASGGS